MTVNIKKKNMISTSRNNILATFGIATALFFVPVFSFAQEALTLSVSPTIFDMTGTPGQTWSSTVRVINVNPYELKVFVEPANFVPKGEGGVPQFKPLTGDESEAASFAKWISLNQEVTIGPEKTVEVPFTITVPADATPGGHYAALMVRTRPSAPQGEEMVVQTSQVVSSLIFLRVTGDVLENSSVRSFRTTSYIVGKPEATFELRIENRGNVHVQPQGEIKIFNMWGQERGVVPVNQKTLLGNVLPQSVRKFTFDWKGEWAFSDVGRYTAIATLAYGVDSRQFMTADTAFWIIPWKFILIAAVSMYAFFKLFSWGINLYIRRMLALAGVSVENANVPHHTAVETPAPKKRGRPRKMAEVVAPIEVGILDLRTRLQGTKTVPKLLATIASFVRAYWKFFVVAVAVLVFLSLVVWFVRSALDPTRDFEVTIQGDGQSVTMTNEDLVDQDKDEQSVDPDTIKSLVPVSLVNRSGKEDALEVASEKLKAAGFVIGDKSTDMGAPQQKTVVVYDQDNEKIALEISGIFDEALLSAFTNNTSEDGEVVVYIGLDAVNEE